MKHKKKRAKLGPESKIKSKYLHFLIKKADNMPSCVELAKLCMEIAIRLRRHQYLLDRNLIPRNSISYFRHAAILYKKFHMDAEAKGAYLSICKELVKQGKLIELRWIRKDHIKGKI